MTLRNRFSALHSRFPLGLAWPDGSIAPGDRQAIIGLYDGISSIIAVSPTASERLSAMQHGTPWGMIVPDGLIDSGDRQTIAGAYSGISTLLYVYAEILAILSTITAAVTIPSDILLTRAMRSVITTTKAIDSGI